MKAQITGFLVTTRGAPLVWVSSACGATLGRWAGRVPPVVGRACSVELGVATALGDETATRGGEGTFALASSGADCVLSGRLESVDPDGMGHLRLAEDCLVMVEATPGWDEPGIWVTLRVPAERLTITPSGA
jgi:hypothetical protein